MQTIRFSTTTGIVDSDLTKLRGASKAPTSGVTRMSPNANPRGTCPICSHPVEISKKVFAADFQCGHCGAPLRVSTLYGRTLGLIGVLLGYSLAWKLGNGNMVVFFWGVTWRFLLLCLPLSFLVLSFLVRIAPYLVKPTLVLRRTFESHLTTLNLSSGPEKPAGTATDSELETRTWDRS